MQFRNLIPNVCEDSSTAALYHGNTKAPRAIPGQTLPLEARDLPDHTHNSQMPLGLAAWLSADIYSFSSAEFRKSLANPLYTLMYFLFLFVWILFAWIFFFFSWGEKHKGGIAPRDFSLPLGCCGAVPRVMNPPESKGWCRHAATMLSANPEQVKLVRCWVKWS